MDEKRVLLIAGGVGAVLLVIYLLTRDAGFATGPQEATVAMPDTSAAVPPLYSVGSVQMPTAGYPDFNLTSPGTGALFTFNDPENNYYGSAPGDSTTSADGGTSGGCGCNDNACSNSGSGVDAYGTAAAIQAAFGPFMGYLVDQLPTGIVAPGAFDPGASPIKAQVSAWQANKARITDSFNVLRSGFNNVALANI